MRSGKLSRPALLGIIGYPLEHTASPRLHNTAFELLRVPWHYAPFPLAPGRLSQGTEALRQLKVAGLNVTVPHKVAVLDHLDSVSAEVESIGAANTVVVTSRGWRGENTDVSGFLAPLHRHRRRVSGRSAVLFGAGGAARAVAYALIRHLRVEALLVVARRRGRAEQFAEWAQLIDRRVVVSAESLGRADDWEPAMAEARLVVNATPAGMIAAAGTRLLPAGVSFRRHHLAYDLVYGRDTDFLRRARRAGAATLDGRAMLWAQAARSFELWTGLGFPVRRVRSALGDGV